MYDRVREKIMSEAAISRACANFLSDVDLKPGLAQSGGGINRSGRQQVRFVANPYGVDSDCNVLVQMRGLVRGSLTHQRYHPRAVLDLEYSWCRYREHLPGTSSLTLFDVPLPEQVCIGLPRDTYRLCKIIDFSRYKPWFFIRANPIVRSIRNVKRLRTMENRNRVRSEGLLFTMVDECAHEHWAYWSSEKGYSDRMD
jgi:hypothetical protein